MKKDSSETKALRQASKLSREAHRILKYRGSRLDPGTRAECGAALEALKKALVQARTPGSDGTGDVEKAADTLSQLLKANEKHLQSATVREYVESIGMAVILALLVRAFIFEAFHIPTGSMIPTVNIADHMFVNKYVYGLRIPFTHKDMIRGTTPARGEIVVFDFPVPGESYGQAFLKRVIGLPGDRIKLENNVLVINGKPVTVKPVQTDGDCHDANLAGCLCDRQVERLGDAEFTTQHVRGPRPGFPDACRNEPAWPVNNPMSFGSQADNPNFPEVVVPAGHVFCMGDNRDNSSDGRYWGFVPIENIRGRATIFWWPPSKMFKAVK